MLVLPVWIVGMHIAVTYCVSNALMCCVRKLVVCVAEHAKAGVQKFWGRTSTEFFGRCTGSSESWAPGAMYGLCPIEIIGNPLRTVFAIRLSLNRT